MFFHLGGRSASPRHSCAPPPHKKCIPAGFRLPPLSCTDSARESRYSPSHRFLFLKSRAPSITQNGHANTTRALIQCGHARMSVYVFLMGNENIPTGPFLPAECPPTRRPQEPLAS